VDVQKREHDVQSELLRKQFE
jgi:hypothetical protein